MEQNKRVLEALQMQPLSEEEKASRRILGRLYGPIATCKESTRNGRLYNKPLWEKALQDEILKEKVATKALFLELGHPADREETDMTKICACIPEVPKIVDDDLYAYVDILDTPNGKILKTLCDYGFVPGISSRGSGDLMANNEVDPETFFLETWDIVQLPAVKKARLTVCEGLDTKNIKLKKALTESLQAASEEDKKVMEETLKDLNIELQEDNDLFPGGTPKDISKIPFAPEDPEDNKALRLNEETEEEEVADDAEVEAEAVEETESPAEGEPDFDNADMESGEDVNTVGDLIKGLETLDKDTEYTITIAADEDKALKVIIGGEDDKNQFYFGTTFSAEDVKNELGIEDTNIEAEETGVTNNPEAEQVTETEEASDAGEDEEVIESLKEMVRQNNALKKEVKTLKDDKAASDTRVEELTESLNKYKTAFERTSALASKARGLRAEVSKLNEQLSTKDAQIRALGKKAVKAESLTESVNVNASKVKRLNEQLDTAVKENETLQESIVQKDKKIQERTAIAKKYQNKFFEAVNRYIDFKASMLGVRTADIKNKLNENFTMDDVDKVCDDLLNSSVNLNRLPFGTNRVRVNESKAPSTQAKARVIDPDNGYEIDDSLLVLAGLK